ncbi:hypothetical protein [Hyphomicrobium sp. CS1GBMeth3]|uniref:hypothetical protein n=1 Tax=Hyphomicrobium sp. CS1GBMeth3 TaxID=1892845 RepID=UPI0009310E7A|nr:hypothetical protein [Hyphomicrobium sp. CS1GBMeth3]
MTTEKLDGTLSGRQPNRVHAAAAFCLLVIFFFASSADNRVEAVDTLSFSANAEVAPFWSNPDSRMILFYRLNRLAFRAVDGLGLNLSVYTVIGFLSASFAAGAVLLLYRLLSGAFGLSAPASIAGALTLAFSYGFLRYASEIEVYAGGAFLILLCLNILLSRLDRSPFTIRDAIGVGTISGLAVSYYQPTAFPLFFAAAVLFLHRRFIILYVAYGAAGVATYALIAILALWTELGHIPGLRELTSFLLARSEEFHPPQFGILSFAKAALAILHDFTSLTWLHGMPGTEDIIRRFLPYHHYYAEEIFFAARQNPFAWIAAVTFVAVWAWLFYLIITSIRATRRDPLDVKTVFVVTWLAFAGTANLLLNPGETEVWIVTFPAIAILLAVTVYEPLRARAWQLTLMVVLLLCHNLIGIAIYRSEAGDLFAGRTSWVREHGERGDWLLTTGEPSDWFNRMRIQRYPIANKPHPGIADQFFNFMYFDGETATVQSWGANPYVRLTPDEMLKTLKTTGNRLFILDAVLEPRPMPARIDNSGIHKRLAAFGAFLKGYAKVVDDGPLGKTYEIDKARLPDTLPKL